MRTEPFQDTPEDRVAALHYIAEKSRGGNLRAFQMLISMKMDYDDGRMSADERAAWESAAVLDGENTP